MAQRLHIAVALALVLGVSGMARGEPQAQAAMRPVDIEEHLGEKVPLDLPFVDQNGKAVKLGELFHGKPVVLSLVYFRCPMLCSLLLSGQTRVMRELGLELARTTRR